MYYLEQQRRHEQVVHEEADTEPAIDSPGEHRDQDLYDWHRDPQRLRQGRRQLPPGRRVVHDPAGDGRARRVHASPGGRTCTAGCIPGVTICGAPSRCNDAVRSEAPYLSNTGEVNTGEVKMTASV